LPRGKLDYVLDVDWNGLGFNFIHRLFLKKNRFMNLYMNFLLAWWGGGGGAQKLWVVKKHDKKNKTRKAVFV
jgi:hypothetical protein